MFLSGIRLFSITAGWLFIAAAQDRTPGYVVDQCYKAVPGKAAEVVALIHDVSAKYHRVLVDEGNQTWWLALSAVVPTGTAARCDFHVVAGYKGFPPEPATAEQVAAGLKKAGVNMTSAQFVARRDSIVNLVNTDIWRTLETGGGHPEKGAYVRIDYYKTKPGQEAAFMKLNGSHPNWQLNTLALPAGESLHYNASTVSVYPTWEALGKDSPTAQPDLYASDVLHMIELVTPKQ